MNNTGLVASTDQAEFLAFCFHAPSVAARRVFNVVLRSRHFSAPVRPIGLSGVSWRATNSCTALAEPAMFKQRVLKNEAI